MVALPAIALALTAVGTATAVAGAVSQGVAASNAAKYNQQVANNNAVAAQQQAQYTANQKDLQLRQIIGQQQAAGGASGFSQGGSLTDVGFSSEEQGKLDQLGSLYQGQVQATNFRDQAQLQGMAATNAMTNAGFQSAGSLIQGASSGAYQYGNISGYGAQPSNYEGGFPELDGY
jgi:hypothetical protein